MPSNPMITLPSTLYDPLIKDDVTVMVENGGHGYYTAEAVRDIMAEYFGMNVQNIVEDMSVSSEMESYR